MRFSLFNGNWDLSHKVAIGSVCGNVVLACTVLVQGIVISTKGQETIITPPVIDQAYHIQRNSANVEYYQSMAAVFANIIGQTTPKTVDNTLKTLNQFTTPALQRQLSESLNALINKLPKENFTTWFLYKDTFYEPQTEKIFIRGSLQSSMIGSRILDQPVVYEFVIKMNAGKPRITYFDSYEGTRARTLAFIRAEQAQKQKGTN